MTRAKKLWLSVGGTGLVLGILAVVSILTSQQDQPLVLAVIVPVAGWSFVFAGLVGWVSRPDSRTGALLAAVGLSFLLLATLWSANSPLLFTLGNALGALYVAVAVHLLVTYPTGRLRSRLQRLLVGVLYVVALLSGLLQTFFDADLDCSDCPRNEFLIRDDQGVADALVTVFNALGIVLFLAVFVLLAARWRAASPARRRVLTPVYVSGGTAIVLFGLAFATGFASDTASNVVWALALAAFLTVPFVFLAGLLRRRFARAGVRLLLDAPDEPTPEEAEAALQRALGDPTLRLGSWHHGRDRYVDAAGKLLDDPAPAGRLATKIEYEGSPLAAIEYDASLRHEPELLEEVLAAARVALEKDRGLQALRQAEARQRALLNTMPDLIIRTARDGTYLGIEGETSGLTRPKDELLGRTIWDVLPPETAAPLMETVFRTLDTGLMQTIEYQLEIDGVPRDFEARMIRSGPDEVLSVVREFTERRRLENELHARLAQLEREQAFTGTVVNTAPIVIVLVDPEGGIVNFNDTTERLLGVTDNEDVRGRPFWEIFVHPDDRQKARGVLGQLAAGAPRVRERMTWVTRDGEQLVLSTQSAALLDGDGRLRFLISALDVTERERHIEEIRASRSRLVEAGDRERRRLERNLHDGAQQRLVSLSIALRLAQSKLRTNPQESDRLLASAAEELSFALEELRELARGIHPAVLTDRGLAAALEAVAQRAPIPVDLEAVPEERLPAPVEAAAFYVVSESLANVAKYAQASAARVSVVAVNGNAVVEVADDGVGGANPTEGTGLRGLADRVEALDGRLEVMSPPGGGTHVRAVIPIAEA